MKLLSLLLIGCLAWFAPELRGQSDGVSGVTVELTTDQDQFLSNEDLRLGVRIVNRSGQTLHFGKGNDWLTFTVEGRDSYVVSQLGEVPVEGEFSLDSSLAGTKRVNLTPYFDFRKTGRYEVIATVKIPQWDKEVVSKPKTFDIINGTKLREFEFGVPPSPGQTNVQPEMRKYILQQAIYLKQMKLYLRLTDADETSVFKVFPLAPMVSFSQPEAQVDRLSNLHVLSQIGPRSSGYFVINPEGEITVRQTYGFAGSRPVLRVRNDGIIAVVNGTRRMTANDLPDHTASQSPNVNANAPAPTP